MQKNSVTLVLVLLAMLACPSALADGLISQGHVNGPYTVLTLTKEQISSLAHGKDKIILTDSQRKSLEGLPNAAKVRELEVVPVTTETCTCELFNVAVRISKSSIEVASELFGRDFAKQDKEQAAWDNRRKEQEEAKKRELSNLAKSPEARLNLLGEASLPAFQEKAIGYFQAALKINPNYKWARRNLAACYSGLANNAMYNKPDYEKATHFFELALSTADPTDKIFIESTKANLKFADWHKHKNPAR
jgi:tetratricopeptide (TPR) repeat protein